MRQGLQFGLLGPLLVCRDGVEAPIPPGKQRVIAAALPLSEGQAVTSDELAELLWPAGPPPSGRVTVQNYVKRFRRALGDDDRTLITLRSDGYVLRVPAESLDASRFEVMVARAREGLRAGQHAQAAAGLREALSLWRGRPLADVPSDYLAMQHVPRLEELRLQAGRRPAHRAGRRCPRRTRRSPSSPGGSSSPTGPAATAAARLFSAQVRRCRSRGRDRPPGAARVRPPRSAGSARRSTRQRSRQARGTPRSS